ncbi:MAG TPA: DUF4290 domain-containing protein [Cyclobacteriaceae bacterium]|nr:DUF4290 domain-containing protein [Cyclobacteriaceae bacterium]
MKLPEYNSQRPLIILKEYGRNVQEIVAYIRTVEDKAKRTELAYTLIELIKQLNPTVRESAENPQRLWDDLFIIADFNLDVNNPFNPPERDILSKRPKQVPYPQTEVRFKHYGKNIERLVKEALKKEDPKEREDAVIYLGKLMKTFYSSWNKEVLDDVVILKDIQLMSGGKLSMSIDKIREDNLFEKLYREKKAPYPQGGGHPGHQGQRRQGGGGGGGRPFKKRFNPHRRRDQ